jgi:SAM-dependent methyltransferase
VPHAATYTDVLVPRLLAPWAEVLVDALDPVAGSTVIDVATGSGTIARAAARRLGRIGKVLACDPDPTLVAAARATTADPGAAPITYTTADADALPYPDGIAAGVTCQLGVHRDADPATSLREMHRVCAHGGRLVVTAWRRPDDSPVFAALWTAAVDHFGPHEAADAPWSITDPEALGETARQAGWRDVEVAERDLPIEFRGGPGEVVDVLTITKLREQLAALDAGTRAALVRRTAESLGSLVERDGAVRSRTGAHFLLARA